MTPKAGFTNAPKLRFKADDGSEFPEWQETMLSDICVYRNERKEAEKCYYISTENMKQECEGIFQFEETELISGVAFEPGNVLVANIRPYLKKAWAATFQGVASADVLVFKATNVIPSFLHTLIARETFFTYVMTGAKGVKMPRGDKSHIMEMPVGIPSLSEQQKIADFFTSLDDLISAQSGRVEGLKEYKKGMMQKVFSQEVRFKADDGSDFPEWKQCELQDICQTTRETVDPTLYPEDSFSEYSMPAYDNKKTPTCCIGKEMHSIRFVVSEPMILFNKLNVRKKRIWKVLCPAPNSVCSTEFIPILPTQNHMGYLEIVLGSDEVTEYVKAISTGTSNSQKRITPSDFWAMEIPVPSLPEQQKIADFFTALDEVIDAAKERLEALKEMKKGFMQQMFV